MGTKLIIYIIALIIVLAAIAVGACIFWGLGVLIVKVFEINYNWTFWHGLCVQLVFAVVGSSFKK